MAVVLVTGGSGTLGSMVVARLRASAHDVRVLSRRPEGGTHRGDLSSGEGVAEAVDGADLIVHAASDTRRMGRTDVAQTRSLLSAVGTTSHLLYVSIVGIDQLPYRYYRQKLQCESIIASSGVPHTIFRATQFHELLALVMRAVERVPVAPLPLDFMFQPVAAGEVADRIVDLLGSPPAGRAPDMGGPELLDLGRIAEAWRQERKGPRRVIRLPLPGRIAAGFRQGLNTCPEHADGTQTWADFVPSVPVR